MERSGGRRPRERVRRSRVEDNNTWEAEKGGVDLPAAGNSGWEGKDEEVAISRRSHYCT